jgi:hypothetical protein
LVEPANGTGGQQVDALWLLKEPAENSAGHASVPAEETPGDSLPLGASPIADLTSAPALERAAAQGIEDGLLRQRDSERVESRQ